MAKEGDNAQMTVEERLSNLERKMRETEALVKGLTDELLDLKSVTMRLTRFSEERRQDRVVSKPAAAGGATTQPGSTVVIPKRTAPAASAPQVPEPDKMEMIMQPDGTLKLEKRRGDDHYIIASAKNAATIRSKQGEAADPKKRGDLIVAEEDEKAASKKS